MLTSLCLIRNTGENKVELLVLQAISNNLTVEMYG